MTRLPRRLHPRGRRGWRHGLGDWRRGLLSFLHLLRGGCAGVAAAAAALGGVRGHVVLLQGDALVNAVLARRGGSVDDRTCGVFAGVVHDQVLVTFFTVAYLEKRIWDSQF